MPKDEGNYISHYRQGTLPSLQESKNDCAWPFDHAAEGTPMDESGYEGYVLYVEALVSDNRRRDLDGMLATVCDCLVTARRQLEDDSIKGDPCA